MRREPVILWQQTSNLMVAAHDSLTETDSSCIAASFLCPVWKHHTKSFNIIFCKLPIDNHQDPPGWYHDTTLGGGFKYFYFHPENCGNDPIWLIFFKWVETTNFVWNPSLIHGIHQLSIGLGRCSSTRALSSCGTTGGGLGRWEAVGWSTERLVFCLFSWIRYTLVN